MSIDADMILENERFEQETIRENLRVFLANQEAERLRCERLRENTASRSSAGRSASIDVSMQQSDRTIIDGLCCAEFDLGSGSALGSYDPTTPSIAATPADPIRKPTSSKHRLLIINFSSCANRKNSSKGSSPDFVGSPNIYRSHDHVSSIQMISKDDLLLFKCLPWLTDAVVRPFDKTEEYGVQVRIPMVSFYGC